MLPFLSLFALRSGSGGGGAARSRRSSGLAFRRCRCFTVSRRIRRLRGGLVALGCVVIHIPPSAFELNGGRGDESLYLALAGGAFLLVRSAEALNLLKLMSALFAAILVERHGFLPRRTYSTG